MRNQKRTIHGQPSWTFRSDCVEACLTELGGQLGPVRFKLPGKTIEPFSIAPWAEEKQTKTIPMLKVLRGDFFCCPFGGNETPWHGEKHPPHGETANNKWTLRSINRDDGATKLHATMKTSVRRGLIDKHITLVDGQTVIYQRHIISSMSGPMPIGHHPMLLFPDKPGSGLISVSRFVRGQVYPGQFERPENSGYQSLKPGATFRSLDRVPLMCGGHADLSRYPARRGYEDLVMLTADPKLPFAWSAVVFPNEGYVWFALRNPRVLRSTILWISNGGRHYAPWSSRHINVMGIEDTTSYFHDGLAESARVAATDASPWTHIPRTGVRGYKNQTVIQLDPKRPTTISHTMGIAAIPRGFDHVANIRQIPNGVELRSRSGKLSRTTIRVDWLV